MGITTTLLIMLLFASIIMNLLFILPLFKEESYMVSIDQITIIGEEVRLYFEPNKYLRLTKSRLKDLVKRYCD